jgi:hypothetical protein
MKNLIFLFAISIAVLFANVAEAQTIERLTGSIKMCFEPIELGAPNRITHTELILVDSIAYIHFIESDRKDLLTERNMYAIQQRDCFNEVSYLNFLEKPKICIREQGTIITVGLSKDRGKTFVIWNVLLQKGGDGKYRRI